MIGELKPYADYKDSGLPWLGQVPAHWQLRPAFGAFVPVRERNRGMREKTVLSLSYGRIVIKPPEKLHGLVPQSFETYQVLNPGDVVLRTTVQRRAEHPLAADVHVVHVDEREHGPALW